MNEYWWQRPDLRYENGNLCFAGKTLKTLARQLPSPSFVYSPQRVKENLTRLKTALDGAGFGNRHHIFYAMKANRFAPLLSYLKLQNLCGIDACSPAEVLHAMSCGFAPEQISFTACSLSENDFQQLAAIENLIVNFDSLSSIQRWGELKPGSEIGIRINPAAGVSRPDNDMLQYAGDKVTKFGIYREQFPDALALADKFNLTIRRIHFHTGCGYLNAQLPHWKSILESSLWFVEQLSDLTSVNIGGGLGVAHTKEDRSLDLNLWAQTLASVMGNKPWTIAVEPGDYLVKDAGVLLMQKTFKETKKDRVFVGVNAGFNLAPEPAYYGMPFEVAALSDNDNKERVSVVGNINEALDVWYENIELPSLKNETHLALINAGAYSSSMASNHCMRGPFSEFLLY